MFEQLWQDILDELQAHELSIGKEERSSKVKLVHSVWLSDHQLLRVCRPVHDLRERVWVKREKTTTDPQRLAASSERSSHYSLI